MWEIVWEIVWEIIWEIVWEIVWEVVDDHDWDMVGSSPACARPCPCVSAGACCARAAAG